MKDSINFRSTNRQHAVDVALSTRAVRHCDDDHDATWASLDQVIGRSEACRKRLGDGLVS